MKKYYEKIIPIENSHAAYVTAGRLCRGERDNYYLYENKDCVSIGVGIYRELIVTPEEIGIQKAGIKQNTRISDLCQFLDHLFQFVDIVSWRAYGIANFGLARYIYVLTQEQKHRRNGIRYFSSCLRPQTCIQISHLEE